MSGFGRKSFIQLSVCALLLTAGCDGGGGGGIGSGLRVGEVLRPGKLNIQEFSITGPVPGGSSYHTTETSVAVSGRGYAGREAIGCVDVHRLAISWRNGGNGATGVGDSHAGCLCHIVICVPRGGWDIDYGIIPLQMGANKITVQGSYSGKSKKDSITVIRENAASAAAVEAAVKRIRAPYHEPTAALRFEKPFVPGAGGEYAHLHYATIADVPEDPQSGKVDRTRVMSDLAHHVIPDAYDFVLFYSLADWAGWSEFQGPCFRAAENTGVSEEIAGGGRCADIPMNWKELRGCMVSPLLAPPVGQIDENILRALNGMGRAWGVYWAPPVLPGDDTVDRSGEMVPATTGPYWTSDTRWYDENLPGILHSPPRQNRFNAFDLYAMGLMGYEEVKGYQYLIAADANNPALVSLTVDKLIEQLRARGDISCDGDGRRVPDTDPAAMDIRVLVVLLTAGEEKPSQQHITELVRISSKLPTAWHEATWGRSSLSTEVVLR